MMAITEGVRREAEPGGPAEDLAAAALTLARCFAAGATLWSIAPRWPSHGRHVAVEFVHPVIVGTRALPAVSLDGPGLAASLRLLSRPGDILLALGPADDLSVVDLLDRAEAWGLTRVWLGAGPRPIHRRAEHTVWIDDDAPALAARSGDMVLLYHLLWELTHVVFAHPGLLVMAPDCDVEVCITCADQGQVAEVRAVGGGAMVDVIVDGRHETVDATLVEPVAPGDLLLVHAGVALTTLGEGHP